MSHIIIKRMILPLIALCIIVNAASAQEAQKNEGLISTAGTEKLRPKDPIVTPLADRAEYQVRYYYDMDAGWERNLKWLTPSRQIAQRVLSESISIDRKTQSVCFTRNLGNGKSYSNWIYKGTALSPRGDNKNYYVSGVGVAPAVNFPELSWVNHKNFRGAGKFGERMVFVFRDAAKANTENKSSTKAEGFSEVEEAVEEEPVTSYRVDTKVAYLDAKTQMPVLSNDGNVIRMYFFSQPSGTLVPPKEMVEMLEKRQIEIQKRVALPGNPAG